MNEKFEEMFEEFSYDDSSNSIYGMYPNVKLLEKYGQNLRKVHSRNWISSFFFFQVKKKVWICAKLWTRPTNNPDHLHHPSSRKDQEEATFDQILWEICYA